MVSESIRARLVLLTAALVGMVAVLILGYFPGRARESMVRSLEAQAQGVARMIAHAVAAPLVFEDATTAREVLLGALQGADASYVQLVDAAGRPFAEAGVPAGAVGAHGVAKDAVMTATAPVEHRDATVGSVLVELPLAPLEERVAEIVRGTASLSAAVFLLGLVAAFAIGTVVTRRLREMVETARLIASGNLQSRASDGHRGEAGELASAFNHMLDRLDEARQDLEDLNRDLEARVASRTAELEREVAERRRSADALCRANERFMLAASAVAGAIYEYDVRLERVEWADGIQRIFGCASPEPTVAWWMERIHLEDRERVSAQFAACLAEGSDFLAEYRFQADDGSFGRVLDRGRFVRGEDGSVLRMVGVMENVTAQRLLEEQYHHSQRMEAVGRLAGGVAHDFNNLLTAVLGYADLLAAALPLAAASERELVAEIRTAGERAAALTQQLLTFSRRQVVAPRVIDLNEVVLSLGKMFGRVIGETIQLQTVLARGPMRVRGDRSQIEQVLLNLVVNARDAMPDGGTLFLMTGDRLVAETGAGRFDPQLKLEPGRYVRLSVSDTGCGMDEATVARIFEPFFTTKPSGSGTGLGLATVYGIVEQSGGCVTVESTPGEGTSMSVYLPLVDQPVEEDAPAQESSPRGSERILVVEDEDAVRRLIAGMLRSQGYQVVEAASAEHALALPDAVQREVELVVTDVVMPKMNGRQLVETLRARRPLLPCLFISGYTDDTILRNGVSSAEMPFLGKPFTRAQLLTAVRTQLDVSKRRTAA